MILSIRILSKSALYVIKKLKSCACQIFILTLTVSNLLSFSIPCQYQGLHDKIKKIKSKGGKDKAESYGSGMVGMPSNLQTRLDSPPASFVVSITILHLIGVYSYLNTQHLFNLLTNF